ncbi:MAG TPA: GNAT family N-acetyltransferase, partial [Povalibacter sp.]|nr:GNAT family N-acetyltransferase [Povalibacter sp.]
MTAIEMAEVADAAAILVLQKLAYQSEAHLYDDWSIPPLTQSLDSLQAEFAVATVLKAVADATIVGSVRAQQTADTCSIGRLIVHPQLQRRGIGSRLMEQIEARFAGAARYELFTGSRSDGNIRLYQRH